MQETDRTPRPAPGAARFVPDPGLPVPAELAERLAAAADDGAPAPPGGSRAARTAAAGYYERRGLPGTAEQVLLGPGAATVLFAVLAAAEGNVLVPRPCGPHVLPQAALLGRDVHTVAAPAECGGVPDPFALLETVRRLRAEGGDPRILVLSPADDPTGTLAEPELLHEVCEVAWDEHLLVVSDETFRDVLHHPGEVFPGPAEILPARTVCIGDLGPWLAVPGWNAGFARFTDDEPGRVLRDRALEVLARLRACVPGPVQAAAALGLDEPRSLTERAAAANRLHAAVASAVHHELVAAGAMCRPPGAGFQLYPDFASLRPALGRLGACDSASLERLLAERTGLPVLGGHHFGDDPAALHARIPTGPFNGATEQQQEESLDSSDPLGLPHVARALAGLRAALADLAAGPAPPPGPPPPPPTSPAPGSPAPGGPSAEWTGPGGPADAPVPGVPGLADPGGPVEEAPAGPAAPAPREYRAGGGESAPEAGEDGG
ncbi:aminotransferase class I/II-fold pyridoxal phosphate-dependent enzyme [Streptomyces sp. SCUT-3]|uniref:aminotransferase class I/II-fold pyridoxal phosphate-dependent enzyme n=1 Tax=Streptomyces sp. SCUT-3 TaxID=2684469 RepID=UPI0015FB206C|nr:aminotransferase class I/II-fold pyridoxal phosphate-dependent enzyme [Streptomyces sp. SCUT-3]QMV21202.1 aminotransferase class I/II-fold pyridoxal phosphate-dependent enzyme [Streptomyces sp. SCUT-3]